MLRDVEVLAESDCVSVAERVPGGIGVGLVYDIVPVDDSLIVISPSVKEAENDA